MPEPSTKRPELMLVLDLDGVVTDPVSGEVSGDMLDAIAADLKRGVPVAFNTGRSLKWMRPVGQSRLRAPFGSKASPM